ncbi:hypothetical protein BRC68_06595 [Halobacteriales archaeon QH_6_64_20]|nr:MAG: hypothetical protein BRC68_06595 [Halobacteriales archaeon QH_6_64_20]
MCGGRLEALARAPQRAEEIRFVLGSDPDVDARVVCHMRYRGVLSRTNRHFGALSFHPSETIDYNR